LGGVENHAISLRQCGFMRAGIRISLSIRTAILKIIPIEYMGFGSAGYSKDSIVAELGQLKNGPILSK
jgi:hypothetical protein